MLDIKLIQNAVWACGPILLAVTAWLLFRRRLHQQFPWFFRYLLFVIAKSPFLFAVFKVDRGASYFYAYYACEAVSIALAFGVLYEVYRNILIAGSLAISRSTFFSVCVGLMMLAVLNTLFMEVVDDNLHWRSVFILNTVVRLMQVSLLGVLLVLTGFFGFYWQSQTFGIALGYGVYATAELVTSAVRMYVGDSVQLQVNLAKVLSYQIAVVIWISYIYKAKTQPKLSEVPSTSLVDFVPPLERLAK